ncbi:MAG: hypothetical protein WCO35_01715 [Candidatus Nomurabacteria bacterium]
MKNLFVVIVFLISFSFSFSSYGQAGMFNPTICSTKINQNSLSYWIEVLSKADIITENTSVDEYQLFGFTYYLVYGENHKGADIRPLLIFPVKNGCWKEIGNLDLVRGNLSPDMWEYANRNNYIEVAQGCVITKVNFFYEARFIRSLWKKFPNANYWHINY